jgi:uncharacterized protein (TIGR01777 family)
MRIAIVGGTGFVGQALTELLISHGYEVFIFTRNKSLQSEKSIINAQDNQLVRYILWSADTTNFDIDNLPLFDAIVNLAGESLSSGRWTTSRKQRIINSRINTTKAIVSMLDRMQVKPSVLINASAIGFYGTSATNTFTEKLEVAGNDYLASVVQKWEHEASQAEILGIRVVYMRFGLILDRQKGALPRMILPYNLFVGGPLGSGQQCYSWIHIYDVINMIKFTIENDAISGAINVTAPNPVTMNEFGKTLSSIIHRPHWLPTPAILLKTILGEMSVLVLDGQRVIPEKALSYGFKFKYPQLREALVNIFN